MKKEEQAFVQQIDTDYSCRFAKSMEQFKTNEMLGYRTAGSRAEWETGELIRKEMETIGLHFVRKDEICVDSWEFKQAVIHYKEPDGKTLEFQLGAYQTDFHTDGWQEYELIDVGKGRAQDYRGLDAKGKLVLIRINQREEWWISYPVYQAHLKGAAAVIAVQEGGYGEIDDHALNAQDIGGPCKAPAFSMSRADAGELDRELKERGAVRVEFLADSTVKKKGTSYNITGEILGKESEPMLLVSAHYDSYFSGFQDDNAAIGMMLGIARALVNSGYQPQKTLLFCAMAAEEWGMEDSKYDWSAGAYKQVFEVHPEWQGKIVADINFELPAHAHGERDGIRCVREYADFIRRFLREMEIGEDVYSKGVVVHYPIETMSDDFSMAIAGIPSMVNEFTCGQFMETHYHSQFDNETFYDDAVYRFHHELYGRLLMAFDRTLLPPFQFKTLFDDLKKSMDLDYGSKMAVSGEVLAARAEEAIDAGESVWRLIRKINRAYELYRVQGKTEERRALEEKCKDVFHLLMGCFRKAQDSFVRLNWHDEVLFPQEAVRENLYHIQRAVTYLERGDIPGALEAVYLIDNNRYAFLFDEEVFRHFTDYVMNQEPGRLMWGQGRIVHHENLYGLVKQLKRKWRDEDTDVSEEIQLLRQVEKNQMACYCDDVAYMIRATLKIIAGLEEAEEGLRSLVEIEG